MLAMPKLSRALVGLTVFLVALCSLSATSAAKCPAGWTLTAAGYCFPPGDPGSDAKPCMGECDYCASSRGAREGEPGGIAAGCPTCGERGVCTQCAKIASCLDGLAIGPPKQPSDVYTKVPEDPCPPKCKVDPEIEVQPDIMIQPDLKVSPDVLQR
jgi:hypothetical protein